MHKRHKKKFRGRLSSYVLVVLGSLSFFLWAYGKIDVIILSAVSVVLIFLGFIVCAYMHFWSRVAGVLGVLLALVPVVIEKMPYWEYVVLLGTAIGWWVWKHD
ncbi:MAG: hypothetical protein QXG33_00790 [Candidatus Anstonellales archaeon]